LSYSKKEICKSEFPAIKFFCGAKIMLVPNVKLMSEAIEAHVEKHKKKIKDPSEAEAEAERVRDYLITQVFDIASKT
jgi:hypothetical protein